MANLATKKGVSIYRYVPRDYPQTQYLKMAGIHVDVSGDCCLFLLHTAKRFASLISWLQIGKNRRAILVLQLSADFTHLAFNAP